MTVRSRGTTTISALRLLSKDVIGRGVLKCSVDNKLGRDEREMSVSVASKAYYFHH